jgi:RHS repeat-associated protein
VYDGDAILLEYDGGNVLQARYSHGEETDQPLAMTRGGQSYFYGMDHLGSVRLVTDAAGAVANRYDYDAFGNWEATSYETVANPFGFTARERDAESGLMFYRARYYDPQIGRFISEDPIGFEAGDLNLYRYVFNNPILLIDPTGNFFNPAFHYTKRLFVRDVNIAAAVIFVAGFTIGYVVGVELGLDQCTAIGTAGMAAYSVATYAMMYMLKYGVPTHLTPMQRAQVGGIFLVAGILGGYLTSLMCKDA